MSYRLLDHTADVGVELSAASRDDLFAEALAAFTDLLTERDAVVPLTRHGFELTAADEAMLLVDWLGELLYAYEVHGRLFHDAEVAVRDVPAGLELVAVARGESVEAARHPIETLVKGVTYHGLEVAHAADGTWTATVVFDV